MVPFIDLKRFESGFLDEWHDTVKKLSANAQFIGGAEIERLEYRLKKFCDVSNVISCANGTDAIQLALRATGVGPGHEVIVPDLTFWATFEAVVNVGASPITVDVSLSDGGIDIEAFKTAVLSAKPKAAIIAHLYGWGTEHLDEIRLICNENGVILIEDGAQCFGTTWNDKSIYSNAFIATTSFYPAKVLGAAGDAGAVFTNNLKLGEKVRQLSNHGRSAHFGYEYVGWNSRMDSLQAAFLYLAFNYLENRINSRRISDHYYRSRIKAPNVNSMSIPPGYVENGYCNVMIIDDPKLKLTLESSLKNDGIGFGNIYPSAVSEQVCASQYSIRHFGGQNARKLARSVLNLPLFPHMTLSELENIVEIVNEIR